MPAGPLEPWSDGLLDPFYRSMLGLPEVANAGTVAGMLADASQAGAPSSLPSAELNRAGAQSSLPPVIDFGVFQAAQEVEQLYSGVLPSLDEDDLLQAALPMRQELQQIPNELLDGLLTYSPFLGEVRSLHQLCTRYCCCTVRKDSTSCMSPHSKGFCCR